MRCSWLARSLFLAGLFLAGCEDGDSTGTTTTTTNDGSSTTATTEAPTGSAIVLEPEGLGVADYGQAKAVVVAAITDELGAPEDTGEGCELAGTDVTTTSWKELSVQFADGQFDSYSVQTDESAEPELDLKTAKGIGLGSTVADLEAAYGNQLTIPGLPPEFGEPDSFQISFPDSERTIFGDLSGTTDDAEVESFLTQLCE